MASDYKIQKVVNKIIDFPFNAPKEPGACIEMLPKSIREVIQQSKACHYNHEWINRSTKDTNG